MNLLIINQQADHRVPQKFLHRKFEEFLKILKNNTSELNKVTGLEFSKFQDQELNLVFVDRATIKTLNTNYRGKSTATDVLSFTSADEDIFGELIFCTEVIVSNAHSNQWPQRYEYLYMLVHGFLHLMGLDHEDKGETEVMLALQDKLFTSLCPNQALI